MVEPARDPDALLARLRAEEPQAMGDARPSRGRLKIFFGYAAGVGKTYSMLEAARTAAMNRRRVLLGYIEPHGRTETEALLLGQDLLPLREIEYRGVTLREFDLDAALRAGPDLLLVDELAHTNAAGCRHHKRWQDVAELLEAGIDVWTTLNVQHVESLNDVVAQITGIVVRETLPDRVFDEADEVELVDLPPNELLERFRDGKVYFPEQAERAASRFFRRANLIALRELAMRRVADRVGRDVEATRLGQARTQIWPTTDRLLVCVSPSPTSAKVIRTAKRMASALRAQWIAVHMDTASSRRLDERARHRLAHHLKLAEGLGAETVMLTGEDVAEEVIRYAQSRNATKIVIGKTGQTPWYRVWRGSVVDRLIARSGDIDVYVIRGVEERLETPTPTPAARSWKWKPYALAALLLLLATGVAAGFDILGLTDANLVMTFLLAVVLIAARLGRGPAIMSSLASVVLFNFFFTEPLFTLAVNDRQYLYTFGLMLIIALVVSAMTLRIRSQVGVARERERRTEALYRVSHALAGASGRHQLALVAQEQLATIFGGQAVLFMEEDGALRPIIRRGQGFAETPAELEAARWVYEHRQAAGRGTDTLPACAAIYLPLLGTDIIVGVLGWLPADPEHLRGVERRQLLETFVNQISLALERDRLSQEAQHILAEADTERLRSSLLSSVSHDLRTPLAAIAGSASALLETTLDTPARRELAQTIFEEADRLTRLVENLLHLTRIESGRLQVNKEWYPLDEVVGSAIKRFSAITDRAIDTALPDDFPLVPMDGLLIEQVLVNLLDNASKYSPPGTPIGIEAAARGDEIDIAVCDRGPGLSEDQRRLVFDKFYRGASVTGDRGRGAGLGLAICKAVAQAHGGRIHAEPRLEGGTRFVIALPAGTPPPPVATATMPSEDVRDG